MVGLIISRTWKYRVVVLSLMTLFTLYMYRTTSIWPYTNRKILKVSQNSWRETDKDAIVTMSLLKHPTLLYEPIFLMNPFQLCSDQALNLIIYVHTASDNLHRRLGVRETWGSKDNLKKYNAQIVFVSGLSDDSTISDKLKMESESYGDLVLANFHDSYENLTMKAKSSITWISKYCGNVTYVLKTDDDTFIHLERLQKYIATLEMNSKPVTDLLACNYKTMGFAPIRNKHSKYYVSEKEYPLHKYPPFCQGMAYLMSSDVVHKLNEGIRNPSKNQPFVWLDDVYITGVVFNNLNLKLTDFSNAFRDHANIKLLKNHKSLIFFQTNEIHSLWKNLKLISLTL